MTSTDDKSAMDDLRERKDAEVKSGEKVPDYPTFFKNVLIIIVSVMLWVVLSSNLIYLVHLPTLDRSLPYALSRLPYENPNSKQYASYGGGVPPSLHGEHGGINSVFDSYKFNYGWPYNLKDSNFIGRWFAKMMATSWSTSRGLLYNALDAIKNLDERVLLLIGGPFMALALLLSTGTGFFTTIYGSLQLDLFSIILTVCLFLIVLLIGWFNGMIMSALLLVFFLVKPLITQEGRDTLKYHLANYSHFIAMAVGIFVTINAFDNLDATVAGGMLLAMIGFIVKSLFF
jgi:hypothetical protein